MFHECLHNSLSVAAKAMRVLLCMVRLKCQCKKPNFSQGLIKSSINANFYAKTPTPSPSLGSSKGDTSANPTVVSDTMVDHAQKTGYTLLAKTLSKPPNKKAINLKEGYPITLHDAIVLGYEDILQALLSWDRLQSVYLLFYFSITIILFFSRLVLTDLYHFFNLPSSYYAH